MEWSDYGLNFEWYKDKTLLKKLNLSAQQEQALRALADMSNDLPKNEQEILTNEDSLSYIQSGWRLPLITLCYNK